MSVKDLKPGDAIRTLGVTRVVRHVALHPSDTRVIFEPVDGHRSSASATFLEIVGWQRVANPARRVMEPAAP